MDGTKVLIVEDSSSVLRVLCRAFEQAGYGVLAAANGEQALSIMQRERVDVLITDVKMPKMTGRELCQQLATDGPYLPWCVIIVTSSNEEVDRSWVSDYPCIRVVEKPVGPRHLLRLVRRFLSGSQKLTAPGESGGERRAA
jgi:CheY-like chemotaxis protein